MDGALVVLAVNIAVASLFAAGYAIIAAVNRGQRAALWFSASYLVGMLSPIGDLLVPVVGWPAPLEWLSYTSFLLATLSISATFSLFHGRRPPWRTIALILVGGIAVRAAIWDSPRDTLAYGAAYQGAFFLAALLAVRTVLSVDRRPLVLLLAGIFALIAVNLATKPLLVAALGQGATMADYTTTTYALLSQASTGILLLAAGLVLLLIVAQKAITESERASETDPLSGLLNRRGFDRQAQAVFARARERRRPVSAILFDLDHFKRVNDGHGHAAGDAVIARFAASLGALLPPGTVTGRIGGEEFAALLDGADLAAAARYADAVRAAAARAPADALPMTTVSGGVACACADESLAELIRRADQAAYRAKCDGRNRICADADAATPAQRRAA